MKIALVALAAFIALVGLLLLLRRSTNPRVTYEREAARHRFLPANAAILTEADLAPLPQLVQTYLRRVGAVGRPRVYNFRVHWRGQMKNGQDSSWMPTEAEQVEILGPDPVRLFHLEASRSGLPFDVVHIYENGHATMRVRILSLLDVVDARGKEMDRSETVTLFNDMCLLAPASLATAKIEWSPIDERRVRGAFTNGDNTVSAELRFDPNGDLVDFLSNDRALSADGKTFRVLPWSTPMSDYRDLGPARVAAHGEAVWKDADGKGGDFTYARLDITSLEYNVLF